MEYRKFGRTGVNVSKIGMGTYYGQSYLLVASLFQHQRWTPQMAPIWEGLSLLRRGNKTAALRKYLNLLRHHGGRREKIDALRKGIELGLNLIDTAETYQTEDIVAEAIKCYQRDNLFIATKVFGTHLKYEAVLRAADRSLKNLQCSYIDLYQIHWQNPRVPIKETIKAMEKLAEDGKVRYIGVSNFSVDQLKKAEEALSRNKLISNQVEFNLMRRGIEKDLLPYCERRGIVVIAYQPIAQGALANPHGKLKRVLEKISKKHGHKTPAQIALNWLMRKSEMIFPIPRASRQERVAENVGSVGWSLDDEELKKLEAYA
jgi:diketogulonate reductase-like aldo/keto reductase